VNVTSSIVNLLITIAGGSAGLAIINQVFARRKTNAEAESIEAETAAKLLRGVTDELVRLQQRQIALENRFTESERLREEAERRVYAAERTERELRGQIATLDRAYTLTRSRVDVLTEMLKAAGHTVPPWTPPAGIKQGSSS
jgi:chromosome segregation ATPase